MSRTPLRMLLLGAALAVGLARPASAGDDTNTVSVQATLQNLEGGKARFDVKGRVGYLPNGAVLTISLRVRDMLPVLEGSKEWEKGTLAPIGYQTVVTLSMQSQNPLVRKFLSKELGYTTETTATIGTDDDDIGSPDERSAFAIQTLQQLSGFTTRAKELHDQLVPKLQAPADDAYAGFSGPFKDAVRAVLDDIDAMTARYILWYEGHRISRLEQCLRVLSRAAKNHGKGMDAKDEATMALNDLVLLRAEIDARLPLTPGQTPSAPEKR
jgi:hypothetical protein